MENRNVGLRCPKCGEHERLRIQNHAWFSMMPDGPEPDAEVSFSETSKCCCPKCGYNATVAEFRVPKSVQQMLLEVAELILSDDSTWSLLYQAAEEALEAHKKKGLNG